jgi:cytochrome c2
MKTTWRKKSTTCITASARSTAAIPTRTCCSGPGWFPIEEFESWVAEQKQPAPAPDGKRRLGRLVCPRRLADPSSLAGDPIQQGAYLYHTKGTCIQCHKVEGSPSSNGVLGPNLTKVGSRTSLAAGWMDNMSEDGGVDPDALYENLVEWIYASQEVKPGNLMYYGDNALQHVINPEDPDADPLTRAEVEKIALWLQTLK